MAVNVLYLDSTLSSVNRLSVYCWSYVISSQNRLRLITGFRNLMGRVTSLFFDLEVSGVHSVQNCFKALRLFFVTQHHRP